MKIIVTPEEMRSNATSLRSEKANFEQCISSMRTIVNSMSGVFEGEAATAFVSNFESYNAQFTSFGELLESFAQKLDTAAILWKKLTGDLLHLWDSKKRQFVRGYVLAQRCAETEMSDEKNERTNTISGRNLLYRKSKWRKISGL